MSAIKSTFQIAPNCYLAALLLLSASQASAASYSSVREVLHDTHDTSVRLWSGKCFMTDQLQCQQERRCEEPRWESVDKQEPPAAAPAAILSSCWSIRLQEQESGHIIQLLRPRPRTYFTQTWMPRNSQNICTFPSTLTCKLKSCLTFPLWSFQTVCHVFAMSLIPVWWPCVPPSLWENHSHWCQAQRPLCTTSGTPPSRTSWQEANLPLKKEIRSHNHTNPFSFSPVWGFCTIWTGA